MIDLQSQAEANNKSQGELASRSESDWLENLFLFPFWNLVHQQEKHKQLEERHKMKEKATEKDKEAAEKAIENESEREK